MIRTVRNSSREALVSYVEAACDDCGTSCHGTRCHGINAWNEATARLLALDHGMVVRHRPTIFCHRKAVLEVLLCAACQEKAS